MSKEWGWVQLALWIIVIFVFVWGGTSIYKINQLSKTMEEQSKQIVTTLEKTNILLEKYNEMPPQIEEIKTKITSLNDKTGKIKLDADKLQETQYNLNKDAGLLNNISINLIRLEEKYPPVQSQNIVFQNISKDEANTLIQNAINQRSWNLTLSFAFGSLIGISLSWVFFQFIYKKYIIKRE